MARSTQRLISVEREDIPAFANEEEEHRFWSAHSLGSRMLAEMQPAPEEGDEWAPPARSRTRAVLMRFSDDTIARAKALAARRHVPYQTMLKEFMSERLYEEEKRAGLR
ncbi:MAG TPA: CopG family antitoxin [Chloroflexota bacterium]|jgi:hypothetical protein